MLAFPVPESPAHRMARSRSLSSKRTIRKSEPSRISRHSVEISSSGNRGDGAHISFLLLPEETFTRANQSKSISHK